MLIKTLSSGDRDVMLPWGLVKVANYYAFPFSRVLSLTMIIKKLKKQLPQFETM